MRGAARGERERSGAVDRRALRRLRRHHGHPRLLRRRRSGRGRLRHRAERGRQVDPGEARGRPSPGAGGAADVPRRGPHRRPRPSPASPRPRVRAAGRDRLRRADGGREPHPSVREPVPRPLRGAVRPLPVPCRASRATGGHPLRRREEAPLLLPCPRRGHPARHPRRADRRGAGREHRSNGGPPSETVRRGAAPSSSSNRTSTSSRTWPTACTCSTGVRACTTPRTARTFAPPSWTGSGSSRKKGSEWVFRNEKPTLTPFPRGDQCRARRRKSWFRPDTPSFSKTCLRWVRTVV